MLAESAALVFAADDRLLDSARSHWELGDWQALASMDLAELARHPQRGRIALLVAAARLQLGDVASARHLIADATAWGCPRELLARVLIAGVFNTLGRAAALARQPARSAGLFRQALEPSAGQRQLLAHSRAMREMMQLGLLGDAGRLIDEGLELAVRPELRPTHAAAQITMLRSEVELMHHTMSIAMQRAQLPVGGAVPLEGGSATEIRSPAADVPPDPAARSTSQLGQDLWVLERSGHKRGGFFVEFGATDGVVLSNTYLLESGYGWTGLCAEPNPQFFEQLRRNRRCTVSPACIGARSGELVEFVLADVYGGFSHHAETDMHADKRNAYRLAGKVMTCETISLDDFLERHGAPRDIDYLSIDTEGSEYEILESFPFEKWKIRWLTVEHNYGPNRDRIRTLLEARGYQRTEREFDDWYELATATTAPAS